MHYRNDFTGQRINNRVHNDNAAAKYSAPSANFKELLACYANPLCQHCSGTGYIRRFKHVCAGRCFKCIPEKVLSQAKQEFDRTCKAKTDCDEKVEIYLAACSEYGTGHAYLSDGMWITPDGQIYDAADRKGPSSKGHRATLRSAVLEA